jgi:peptide/nickel transport system substrate-binding protein
VDIANNKFGVEYGSYDFMTTVIQSPRNVKVPMGAGAYVATDAEGNDNPEGTAFFSNNVVYFKANNSFLMGQPKIEKIRYQVVSSSNALNVLESGAVHFVTPQFTQNNIDKLNGMAAQGIEKTSTRQLGYGYIGINAGKVPDINIRKAIMCAMDTSLALSYYSTGTAETIYWPMSTVSWAYPKDQSGNNSRDNLHSDYIAINWNRADAMASIQSFMEAAGVSAGDPALSIKFTIAGSNLTEHPTYQTFQNAADLLNECGWNIEVVPDTQALTKLSTGSLAVWAAAWGSTIDPDMYQVYHKNSTATSTLAWGYREILASPALYQYENGILNELSAVIDEARETEDQAVRTALYKEAMGYVLDLAVEMPVYQRDVLYAYNANVIKSSSLPEEINPYTSPLDKIWEIEFAD